MTTNLHAPTDATLDEWVREIVDVHFDPETGSPYWLDWQDERGIDVRERVERFEDVHDVFEPFDEDALRTQSVDRFAPRSLTGECRAYHTGGTTGTPKRVLNVEYWREQAGWAADVLAEDDFPTGNVLMLGPPGGGNAIATFIVELASTWDAVPFFVNMDPLWIKQLGRRDEIEERDRYLEYLVDQAEHVLRTQDVSVLFTTGAMLERPRVRDLVAETGVEGIYHSGTPVDPDTHRVFVEEWYADQAVVSEYGNTLMGAAQQAPRTVRDPADHDYAIDYVPCYPYFVPEIVDDGEPVPYGERGRVRLTTLTPELFVPLLDERDTAVRMRGEEPFPWDWVRNVGTPSETADEASVGVY